jgi:Methyltransferase small domain
MMQSPQLDHLKTFVKEHMPKAAAAYRAVAAVGSRLPLRKQDTRRFVNAFIREKTSSVVQRGPFAGMRLIDGVSWGDGDIAPKLLGVYEQELHEVLAKAAQRHYGAIVDVGSAEGFYAVGLARMFPGTTVYAFDIDPAALEMTRRAAEENLVQDQIKLRGLCDPPALHSLAQTDGPLLILSDCEGYEMTLFGADDITALRGSDILIECHDFIVPNCTERLTEIFGDTHAVTVIRAGGRDPNAFDFLSEISDWDRWKAVCEGRPCRMSWLWCEARSIT